MDYVPPHLFKYLLETSQYLFINAMLPFLSSVCLMPLCPCGLYNVKARFQFNSVLTTAKQPSLQYICICEYPVPEHSPQLPIVQGIRVMAPPKPFLPALLALALPAEGFPGFVARDVACGPCPAAPTVTVTAPVLPPVHTVTVTELGPSAVPPEIQTVTVTHPGPGHGGPPGPNWGSYPLPPPPPVQAHTVTVTAAAPPLPLITLWETVYINHSPSASTMTLTHTETTTPSQAWPSHPPGGPNNPLTVTFTRPYPHLEPPATVTATITESAPAAEHTLPPWDPSNVLLGSDWYDPNTPTWTHPAPSGGPYGPPEWVWGCDSQGGNCPGEGEKPTVWNVETPMATATGWGDDCTGSTSMVTVFNTLTQTVHPSVEAAPMATSEAETGWPSPEDIKAWSVGEEDEGIYGGRGY
ncbi:hypothetical protein B0H67DRAFT_589057 [Lasiosphaeris hirsuta]|uniref:Uncharacterized protein n=1 Tax=Lasiosphaeris hirsuta TaxID=260670 RepID=A0AA40A2D1_9PEZI|nr:hypothetical protein B0H67DRAFT_589057 [Lasiosphaeris hirsuta]